MIYSVEGTLRRTDSNVAVVEIGGVGIRVLTTRRALRALSPAGERVRFVSHLHVREDALELYGFPHEEDLRLFEALISVSGVGPKSALAILDVDKRENIAAAIKEGRPDLLTRASGVGRKTAERVVLELKDKVEAKRSGAMVGKMEVDADLVDVLMGLGYRRDEAKAALGRVGEEASGDEARLRAALRVLSGKA